MHLLKLGHISCLFLELNNYTFILLWKRNRKRRSNSSANCIFEQVRDLYLQEKYVLLSNFFFFSPSSSMAIGLDKASHCSTGAHFDTYSSCILFAGYLRNFLKDLKFLWLILCWQQVGIVSCLAFVLILNDCITKIHCSLLICETCFVFSIMYFILLFCMNFRWDYSGCSEPFKGSRSWQQAH